jgi:TPR repeat protein
LGYAPKCLPEARNHLEAGNLDDALERLSIACEERWEGQGESCTLLGLHARGTKYEDQMEHALDTGCLAGVATACVRSGENMLGELFRGSKLVSAQDIIERIEPHCLTAPDPEELAKYGYPAQAQACNTLAPMFEHGMGLPQDRDRAYALWSSSCGIGDSHACAQVGFFTTRGWAVEKDVAKGYAIYADACEKNSAMGCANLAAALVRGDGIERDYGRAAELFGKACKQQYLDSCDQQGHAQILQNTEGDMDTRIEQLLAQLDKRADELRASVPPKSEGDGWIKQRLEAMFELDQLYRRAFDTAGLDEAGRKRFSQGLGERMGRVDAEHRAELKAIVAETGWPTISRFGRQVSQNAWQIVQHADEDVAWQVEVLATLEKLLEQNEVSPGNVAYLRDRVAVNQKRPQTYGTQGHCVDGKWQPREMVDPEQVDARRAEVGLGSLEEYRASFDGKCP